MVNYKLGKLPRRIDVRTLKIVKFLRLEALPPLPVSYDVDSCFTNFVDTHMFGNDKYGCCFSGDTKIPFLNGSEHTLKELAEDYSDKEFWVYSLDERKNVVAGKGKFPRLTRKNVKILKVTLDNGDIVKCTEDHPFLMRDNSYRKAIELKPEDSLMPWNKGKHTPFNHKVVSIEDGGYEDVYDIEVEKYHNFALSSGVFVHNCVMAGRGHMTLRFEDFEQGKLIPITDRDIEKEYFKETGGQDSGLNMLTSLNEWRQKGWSAAGKIYTIHAYAQIEVSNHNELMYSIYLFRGAYAGFNVPQSAMDQFDAGKPWTVIANDGGIMGGHCIYIVGFNTTGPVCVTWGKKQQMTWAFWDKYFDEAYAIIDNKDSWMSKNDPLNLSALDKELKEVTGAPISKPSRCNFLSKLFHKTKSLAGTLKDAYQTYTESVISILTGTIVIALSAIIEFHSEWQLNMMQNNFIWDSCTSNIQYLQGLIALGYSSVQYLPFQDGIFFRMNTGNASDIFLALIALGWVMALIGMFFIMNGVALLYRSKLETLKKKLA